MKDSIQLEKYIVILEEIENKSDKIITAYDEILIKRLELSPKQIDRLLQHLLAAFDNLIILEGRKKRTYKLIKPIDLFIETFKNSNDIGWFFNLAHDADPEIFKELEQYTNKDKHIYKFRNTPFEDISTLESRDIFKKLKRAVKNKEYAKIKFLGNDNIYDNLKCLKLLFMDNNWYLAFIDNDEKLRLGRISFIQNVEYASNINSYKVQSVEKQMQFLENSIQNSMTLYNIEPKITKIKALPIIARYFDEDMKIFLSTQKFIEKLPDGSIIFELKYTQSLEILPFIQKWLPDLIILEPKELKDEFIRKLENTLINYK
jgi:hypothetical protein